MAGLIRCRNCGNMVARSAKFCPQCGGVPKKSHGCALFIVLIVLIFFGIAISGSGDTKSKKENSETEKIDKTSPENADPFQVEYFSNGGALLFAQNFLEQKVNTVLKVKLKFPSAAKISKFSEIAPELADIVQRNKEKIGTSINAKNVWIVQQEFCDSDNEKEKFSYYALIEFAKTKGYRVIFMSVNGKQLFP